MMKQPQGAQQVLVIGGYGEVGSTLCRELATMPRVRLVIAGRSGEKAEALARELSARALCLDATDAVAVGAALDEADLVINCAVSHHQPTLALPRMAIERGRHYFDLAGVPTSYTEEFLTLGADAARRHALLMTAIGVNPGIIGMLALSNSDHFDALDSLDFYFTMGSKLTGLSTLSMQGVGELVRTPAKQWRDGGWSKAKGGPARVVPPPFRKKVYFGPAMITHDLLEVPAKIGATRFAVWSGIEQMFQGLVFLAGIRTGRTKTPAKAERFLKLLRRLAAKDARAEIALEMVAVGRKAGSARTRTVSLSATEEYATAIAPAIACRQWLDGELSSAGAFVPHQILPPASFLRHLRAARLQVEETIEERGAAPRAGVHPLRS